MKKRIIYAALVLMFVGLGLNGCRSHQLCPAYTDSHQTEQVSENNV